MIASLFFGRIGPQHCQDNGAGIGKFVGTGAETEDLEGFFRGFQFAQDILVDVHGVFPDPFQESGYIVILPHGGVEDIILVNANQHTGNNFEFIGTVRQQEQACAVLGEKFGIFVQIQVAEHFVVGHMVAVEKGVGIGEFPAVPGVQENAARQGKVPVNVGIDIGEVGFPL